MWNNEAEIIWKTHMDWWHWFCDQHCDDMDLLAMDKPRKIYVDGDFDNWDGWVD